MYAILDFEPSVHGIKALTLYSWDFELGAITSDIDCCHPVIYGICKLVLLLDLPSFGGQNCGTDNHT